MKYIKSKFSKLILNNIKLFKWQSVFVRHLTIITVFLIIPSTIFMLVSNYNISKARFISNSNLILNNFDHIIQSCDSIYYSLYDSNDFKSYFFSSDEGIIIENVDKIYSLLKDASLTNPYYDSVYIYDKQRDYVLSLDSSAYFENFFDAKCFEDYTDGTSVAYRYINKNNNTYPVITLYHKIMYENVECGIVAINMNSTLVSDLLFKESENVDFVNSKGMTVFSSNSKNIGKVVHKMDDFSATKIKFGYGNIYLYNSLSSCNLYMISQNPIILFSSPSQAIILIMLILLSCILVAFIITMQYYTTISKILTITSDPYNDSNDSESTRNNELTIIANNIGNLQRENKNMEINLAKQISLLKNSQMVALYTQINPHFIFNTLQIISLLAMKDFKKDTELTRIIHKFSNMLRCTLDTKTYLVSVNEEIEITNNFVEILNIRYKNKFSFEYDIEENVKNHTILKFSLQPLIENAIKHAFPHKTQKDCTVKIKIYKERNNLIMSVTDNGVGMDEYEIKQLKSKLNSSDSIPESSSIGISNINMRYKIIYGNEYGCEVISAPQQGTTIKIILPY